MGWAVPNFPGHDLHIHNSAWWWASPVISARARAHTACFSWRLGSSATCQETLLCLGAGMWSLLVIVLLFSLRFLQMLLEYQPALGAIFFTQQTLSLLSYPTSIYSILSCIFWHPNPASPAFNLWGHVQQGLEVQFVSNFDHIMVLFMLPYIYPVSSSLHVDWPSGRHSLQRCIPVSAYGDVLWWCVVVERAVHV